MVSVIIPCFNHKYIEDTINSLVYQSYKDIEIIIVHDDPDYEGLIVPNVVNMIILQNKENLGTAESINVGIRASKGEYILPLDSDDMLTQNSISCRIKMFEDNPELDVIYGCILKVHDDVSYDLAIKGKWKRHPSEYTVPMYRRRVFQKYGLFHPPMRGKQDKEMSYRLGVHKKSPLKTVVKFKKIEEDVYYYRRHHDSQHKQRGRDIYKEIKVCMAFDKRMKDLEINGITEQNTELLR